MVEVQGPYSILLPAIVIIGTVSTAVGIAAGIAVVDVTVAIVGVGVVGGTATATVIGAVQGLLWMIWQRL